jgi:hypothetical protein
MSTARWPGDRENEPEVVRQRIDHLRQLRPLMIDDQTIEAIDSLIAEGEACLEVLERKGRT